MKQVSCSKMGGDCTWSGQAETTEELWNTVMEHAKEVHADKVAGMGEEEMKAMREKFESIVEDVTEGESQTTEESAA